MPVFDASVFNDNEKDILHLRDILSSGKRSAGFRETRRSESAEPWPCIGRRAERPRCQVPLIVGVAVSITMDVHTS